VKKVRADLIGGWQFLPARSIHGAPLHGVSRP
jgi:hypothetical protein